MQREMNHNFVRFNGFSFYFSYGFLNVQKCGRCA